MSEKSKIIRPAKKIVQPFTVETALANVIDKGFVKETEWMEINGFTVKFRKVPAFTFAKARQNLTRVMRSNKPEPPTVERGTRTRVNVNDPYYIQQIALWESELEDLQNDAMGSTAILVGLVLDGDLPPDEEWVPFISDILSAIDIPEDQIFKSFKYSEPKMKELLFKQYIILADAATMSVFNAFQTEGIDDDGDLDEQAVDTFRSN